LNYYAISQTSSNSKCFNDKPSPTGGGFSFSTFLNPLRFKFPSGDLYFQTLSTIVNKGIVNKMLQTQSFS
ncbi:hypothetical protein OS109_25000, partial [Escherichia coli]|uniref:hypothetical protein n=1 Tax=Escherichia coli TaxID=562 RepID=UPI00237C057F